MKDAEACAGKKNKDGAWAEPDYKNEKGTLVKGKIWCGAISPTTISQQAAKLYCQDNGMELASGYPEEQNGMNKFPKEDSDWVRFGKNSGGESAKSSETPKSYTSDVLPNMSRIFWSSSGNPDDSNDAFYFNGPNGIIYFIPHYITTDLSARCVVTRR